MSLDVYRNFSFSVNTTYGSGGTAKAAYFPENENELCAVYCNIKSGNFCVLGNGSNVLAADGCYDGTVIVTKKVNGITLTSDCIYCECGVTVPMLLKFCKANCLGGLEFLSGIPATVGGLCYMNAGVAGEYIDSVVASVTIFDGKKRILTNKECGFGHKYSAMRDINCIILGCFLKIYPSALQDINYRCRYYLDRRRHLPKGRSCGCVFKNPEGKSAGEIIEAAGLKGYTIGSAKVSERHANFIINSGNCSQDVYELIAYVKRTVYQKFSTELEEEVCYIGDFK